MILSEMTNIINGILGSLRGQPPYDPLGGKPPHPPSGGITLVKTLGITLGTNLGITLGTTLGITLGTTLGTNLGTTALHKKKVIYYPKVLPKVMPKVMPQMGGVGACPQGLPPKN